MLSEVSLEAVTHGSFYESLMGLRKGAVIGISGGDSIQPFLRYAIANLHLFEGSKFILTDERCVSDEHTLSNYGQALSVFGNRLSVTSTKTVFEENWAFIDFDLVIMGFGVDGHFASVFPDFDEALSDERDCSFKTMVPVGNPRCIRYSLSEEVISAALKILLLVNSEAKSQTIDKCKVGQLSKTPLSRLLARRPDIHVIKLVNQ